MRHPEPLRAWPPPRERRPCSWGWAPLLGVSLVVLVLFYGRPARAEDDPGALIHSGVELRKQGRNGEALAQFQRAYALHPDARGRAQVALAEQALGQWVLAERGLLDALGHADDAWIQRYHQPLVDALETTRDHLGTLEVESDVGGATIFVNDEAVGRSPLAEPLRVPSGTVRIRLEAAGHGMVERLIEVSARGQAKATIAFVPERTPGGSVVETPARGFEAPASGGAREPLRAPAEPRRTSEHPRPTSSALPWITLAASGALLATGVVAHVVHEASASAYNDDSRCFYAPLSRDQRCGSYRDTSDTAGIVAIVGYAAGGAALITGTALLLLAPHSGSSRDAVRLGAGVVPGSAYVSCAALF